MKKNKKKLPRYWLGAAPINTGYQKQIELGDTTFTSQRGMPVQPEANAMRQNLLPKAIGNLSSSIQYPLQMIPSISAPLLSASAANAFKTAGSTLATSPKSWMIGTALKNAGEVGGKAMISTAGKVSGGLGTAWGLYNIGKDIAHEGDTISPDQIANSATTNTVTTPGGNTYTYHSGIDSRGIMDYERQLAKSKKIGLSMDALGLGASVGGLIGGLPGMGIGAAVGLLGGGIASLLGFGDNEDETREMIKNQQDVFAMSDRQSEATAKDRDVKQQFARGYGAANGKAPVWTPSGLFNKKATARVSNGEVVGNFADGIATRIPGKKNNKDTKLAALKDGDFVITNKYGLSDYAAATGDYAGALGLQEMLMGMRNSKGYKNGKLPGFKFGWDSALSMVPHIMSFATNMGQYNRARNAETYAPDTYVDNAEGRAAVNELARLRFDDRPYLVGADRAFRQANWDTRRNVGLGIGGRAVAMNSAYRQYLDSLAGINAQKNDADAKYTQLYTNALQSLGAANQQARINSNINKFQWQQQANAAKENWMAQYLKNIDTSVLNGVSEWLRQKQYEDSLATQNKMLRLYERQAETDEAKANAYINSLGNNTNLSKTLNAYQIIKDMYSNLIPTRFGNIRIR